MQTQEEIKRKKREYYLRNKEQFIQRAKIWHEKNPVKAKEAHQKANKKWEANNKEKRKERAKQKRALKTKRVKLTQEELKDRQRARAKKYYYEKKEQIIIKSKERYRNNIKGYRDKAKEYHKKTYKSKKKSAGEVLNELKRIDINRG